jgi:hypothetical protein
VSVKPTHDLPLLHRQYGVPEPLVGCHTTLVEGYVVEGHVPIGPLLRMLTERPAIKGISLPGMPAGSPGMFGEKVRRSRFTRSATESPRSMRSNDHAPLTQPACRAESGCDRSTPRSEAVFSANKTTIVNRI